jgi:hypothetical protein
MEWSGDGAFWLTCSFRSDASFWLHEGSFCALILYYGISGSLTKAAYDRSASSIFTLASGCTEILVCSEGVSSQSCGCGSSGVFVLRVGAAIFNRLQRGF